MWVPAALFLGFLVASSIELIAERNTREQLLKGQKRLESVVVSHTYKPIDSQLMGLLETTTEDTNSLFEITRQQHATMTSFKKQIDNRSKDIKRLKDDVTNLRKTVTSKVPTPTTIYTSPAIPRSSSIPRKAGRPVK